jgi:two-component system nitrogen regulation sensor histidine kinase GlnL
MEMKQPLALRLLEAFPNPVLGVAPGGVIKFANLAAEQFFDIAEPILIKGTISDVLREGNPVRTLIEQALEDGISINEYSIEFSTVRTEPCLVNVQVAPIAEAQGMVVVMLQSQTMASKMDRQLTHRGAARSVTGMAAMLAHEIKNPLSGIKGAAQLLEQSASDTDKPLTELICSETDRIAGLVDRMEVFSDVRPPQRDQVNIHVVLNHIRTLARSGFARSIEIAEDYDPSLPPVWGDHDQLIQAFLNLVKNAAEAVGSREGAQIILRTSYRHGLRMQIPGSSERVTLPLSVSVEDNGGGIATDIKPYLFDPFVSTKTNGSGLGLALVAKIIGDHGGVIECESPPGRTIFRALLPFQSPEQESTAS